MLVRPGFVGRLGQPSPGGEPPFSISVSNGVPLPQTEGSPSTIVFTVSANQTVTSEITFTYESVDGTAIGGGPGDFVKVPPTAGSLTAAQPTLDITVNLTAADAVWRPDRYFILRISNASEMIANANGFGVITDSSTAPVVSIADGTPNPIQQQPGDQQQDFVVSLTGTTTGADVLVDWATEDGTAIKGEDYTAAQGTLTIPAGNSQGTIKITVLGGDTVTGTESYSVRISNARSILPGDGAGTSLTITDAIGAGNISQYVPAPAGAQPIYALDLDEGSGNPQDSGTVQPGTSVTRPASVPWITDGDGTGLNFPGNVADANLDWPPTTSGPLLESYGGFIVYKPGSTLRTEHFGFAYNDGSNMGFDIRNNLGPSRLTFQFRVNGGFQAAQNVEGNFQDGNLHWLAWRVDATNQRCAIIVDSIQRLSTTNEGNDYGGTGANFQYQPTLGVSNVRGTKTGYYDGVIYAARIYGEDATISDIVEAIPGYTPAPGEVLRGGGWSFFNSPTAITSGSHTFVGSVNNAGTIEVAKLLNSSGAVVQRATLDPRQEADDHNDPTAVALTDGNIRFFWNDHGNIRGISRDPIRTRRTQTPGDLSTLTAIYEIPGTNNNTTYTNIFYLPAESRYYLFWRGPNTTVWSYSWSTTAEDGTWSTPKSFITWGAFTGYLVFSSNGNDEIYLGATRSTGTAQRDYVRHGIFKAETVYASDGTTQLWQNPAAAMSFDNLTLVYDSVTANRYCWCWSAARDNVAFATWPQVSPEQDHQAWYGHRTTGNSWTTNKIADVGNTIGANNDPPSYTAGVFMDINDNNTVYVAKYIGGQGSLSRYVTANLGVDWTETQLVAPQAGKVIRPRNSSTTAAAAPARCEVFYMDGSQGDRFGGYAYWRQENSANREGWATDIRVLVELVSIGDGVPDPAVRGTDPTLTFTISINIPAPENIDVDWTTRDDTALAGTDYTAANGTATILQGQTSTTVQVTVLP